MHAYDTYHPPGATGFMALPVLPFLIGHGFDEVALNLIDSLRPSKLRVIGPGNLITDDAWLHRVTVITNDDGVITKITQEVEVGLRRSFFSAYELGQELEKRGIILNG